MSLSSLLTLLLVVGCCLVVSASVAEPPAEPSTEPRSIFFPPEAVRRARENANKSPWATSIRDAVVARTQPWMRQTDAELWELMFGNTIKRAWQVWSNGYCPACKKGVPMYDWQMDPLQHPWKTRCPHCKELFPKNDFGKFYRSGLDEHGIFNPKRADRALLFNAEHPDPKDPLHRFGVDDGEGFVEGDHRWRFIGAYLIFGQWKLAIVDGVRNLAAAYTLTGDAKYAHKAGVLLDRIADLYPTLDFGKEGVMYEGAPRSGYVSTWHDACEETRELSLAYDMVRDALSRDTELATFLQQQAQRFGIPTPKATPADILRHIEERILRDALRSPDKIYSNYPRTEYTIAVIKTILDWPQNRQEVIDHIGKVLDRATATDGVTGEKGLMGYSAFTIQGLAEFLSLYGRIEPGFLQAVFQRQPNLRKTWRFFIDTWCGQLFYPQVGDTGGFARRDTVYAGAGFTQASGAMSGVFGFNLASSMYTFFWNLYQITGDAAYVQVLYHANGNKVDGLPYDLFEENPAQFQKGVQEVIAREGATLKVESVHKAQWHLAILRAGTGSAQRSLWLDYDSGGYHSHADGMNVGLFAYGLDILPDFGYPPVQFGGWGAPRSRWYQMTAAHNTVVIDGKNHRNLGGNYVQGTGFDGRPYGKATLWADGKRVQAVRASGPEMAECKQFERTLAMVDLPTSFYVLDIFRVVGGKDHAKFLRSGYGTLTPTGLTLSAAPDYGYETQMRGFQGESAPKPGWKVDWKIEDRFQYLPAGQQVHLQVRDLTAGAQVCTAESWVAPAGNNDPDGAWIPTLMVRRQAKQGELASTFVSLLEPYTATPQVTQVRRLPLKAPSGRAYSESSVAVEVTLADGSRDLILAADVENPQAKQPAYSTEKGLLQPSWRTHLEGEFGLIRRDAKGKVVHLILSGGTRLQVGDLEVRLKRSVPLLELDLTHSKAQVLSGARDDLEALTLRGKSLL